MTSITLKLQNMVHSISETLEKNESKLSQRQVIRFDVRPIGRERIKLSTNEVFTSTGFARTLSDGETPILGQLTIIRGAQSEEPRLGMMRYFGSTAGTTDFGPVDGGLSFHSFMKDENFDVLLANIRAGMRPSQADVNFGFDMEGKTAFQLDWAPDGSEKKWDVADQKDRVQPIESIEFSYLEYRDDEGFDDVEIGTLGIHKSANNLHLKIVDAMTSVKKSLNIIIGILVALAIMYSFR